MQQYKCSSPKGKYAQLDMTEDVCDDISLAHADNPMLELSTRWEDEVMYISVSHHTPELVLKVLHDYFGEVQYIPQVIK